MKFERLTTYEQVLAVIKWHSTHSYHVVLDVETTSKDARAAHLLDIQLSGTEEGHVVMFGAEHREVLLKLAPGVTLVAHNAKYDLHVLYRHGVNLLDRPFRCTVLMGHLVDENRESYKLDSYVRELYGSNYKDFWEKYKSYEEAPEEERLEYGCRDVAYSAKLYERLREFLAQSTIPDSLVESVHNLQRSLLQTEIEGIRVDEGYLTEKGVEVKLQLDAIQPRMRELAKDEIEILELKMWLEEISEFKTDKKKASTVKPTFNFGSAGQLAALLYGRLGITPQHNEKTKRVSTDYDSLCKVVGEHPVVAEIQKYRDLSKTYDAFIVGIGDKIKSGRVHPEFRVNGTKGARISHSNPNLGQLPASGGIKGVFVPDEGYVFGEFDYGQLEVCVEAHLTQDRNLLSIVRDGVSKHDITAKSLGIDRSLAKTLNFAMQYWCSSHKVKSLLKCSDKEAELIYNKYWETYSGPAKLKAWSDKQIDDGKDLVDMFGRRRRFGVRKRRVWDKDYRSGYNFLVQSPGGQMTNNAFYVANNWLREKGMGKGVLTVHDSCLMSFKKGHEELCAKFVEQYMITEGLIAELTVPLKVTYSGPMERWLDK